METSEPTKNVFKAQKVSIIVCQCQPRILSAIYSGHGLEPVES